MLQQEDRLIYGPGEQHILHRLPPRDGDPLDILVGKQWGVCHVHYKASDGRW